MPSKYFEGNAQLGNHSYVVDFYHQIYFEPEDNVANCIVECFNQKDYTMYANYEQVLLKGTLGELSLTKCWPTVWVVHGFWLRYPTNPAIYSGRVLHSFRQGEGMADALYNVTDFHKKNKKIWSLIPGRGHVLGQDYSGYASNKCQLWKWLQCSEKGEDLIPYNRVE